MTIQKLFPFAAQAGFQVPSARFAERFNAVAAELNVDRSPDQFVREDPAVRSVLDEMERQRLEAVKASALFHKRIPFRAPLERLSPPEQEAVRLFATGVKPALDRIEARQQDPLFSRLAAWMVHHGDDYSKSLWGRFRQDVLAGPYVSDPKGSLFPFFPDRPAISGMFERSITLEDFRNQRAALSVHAEELRPTTFLKREVDGKIVAIPLPLHPDFRDDHLALAAGLDEVADLPLNGRLQNQLLRWAQFFRTGSAQDEAQAAQATIDAGEGGGLLRIHVGPSESYWKDNTKFAYLLQVGIRDPELVLSIEKGKESFLDLERCLDDIPHYAPRALSTRGGFADPIYQAITGGMIESFPIREPLGNNFPNYSYPGVEGSNRFILLEGMEVAARQIKTALSRLLDEDLSEWNASAYTTRFVVAHESGHLLGPLRGHVTPDGRAMGAVFGDHWGSADEPKADLTVAPLIRIERANGKMTDREGKDLLRAFLGSSLSNRYRGKAAFATGKLTDHFFGHMLQVGWFFRQGALSLTDSGRFHVDYGKLRDASEELWRRIIRYQAAGDLEGYLAFSRETVSQIPDEADALILKANEDQRWFFIERYLP